MMGYSYYGTDGWSDADIWQDDEGDTMRVQSKANGQVRGHGNSFDFERDSMEAACAQLREWGYRFIGSE